jgi:hypothetical protein
VLVIFVVGDQPDHEVRESTAEEAGHGHQEV